jgi:hypothetical protein
MKKYFISFVEEFIFNKRYKNYVAGRVEVYDSKGPYDIDEFRFFTKRREKFYRFRDKWDFKHVSKKQLSAIKGVVKRYFNE